MKIMIDYHKLFWKCDILLLADVFRNSSLKSNGLFSSYYVTAQFLSKLMKLDV